MLFYMYFFLITKHWIKNKAVDFNIETRQASELQADCKLNCSRLSFLNIEIDNKISWLKKLFARERRFLPRV